MLNVGNLPPGKVSTLPTQGVVPFACPASLTAIRPFRAQECVITFRYVSELTVEGEFVRMILPITRLPIFGHGTTATTPTGHQSDECADNQSMIPPLCLPCSSFFLLFVIRQSPAQSSRRGRPARDDHRRHASACACHRVSLGPPADGDHHRQHCAPAGAAHGLTPVPKG